MLCLSDSIRHDDPSMQQLLNTIEKAQTLTQLILAVWPLARVLSNTLIIISVQMQQFPLSLQAQ
jgi:hypothetical protein